MKLMSPSDNSSNLESEVMCTGPQPQWVVRVTPVCWEVMKKVEQVECNRREQFVVSLRTDCAQRWSLEYLHTQVNIKLLWLTPVSRSHTHSISLRSGQLIVPDSKLE